jgi:hypothetical protein
MFPRLNNGPVIQPSILLTASNPRLEAGTPQSDAPRSAPVAVFVGAAATSEEQHSAGLSSAPPRAAPALWRLTATLDRQNTHRARYENALVIP